MKLRPVTTDDAKALAWISQTDVKTQIAWLERELPRKDISMFMATAWDEAPVGWGQIDHGSDEMRWVVAPDKRRQGWGTFIAKELARRCKHPMATIHPENRASIKIAQTLGLVEIGETDNRGYLIFR